MLSLRANGAPQLDVLCEDGSRALLEAKKHAAAPETPSSGPIWYLIPPPKKADNTAIKDIALRSPWPGERQSAIAEEAARSFGERVAALGNAPPTLKPLKAPARGAVIIKVPSRDLCLVALASAASRVAKGVWTGEAWEQRMSVMRRFGEFAKKRGSEMLEERVAIFIVSLGLVKSGAAQCARALLSLMAAGGRRLRRWFRPFGAQQWGMPKGGRGQ
ncbi:hypothetical protein ERJ75_001339300 [Trypanosoma vivax]|nr:hypothetical protein ERJ75_001338100 [Trypanosoma vivax]KAH8608145.1 hypothetical protein ERJ75_001339300 [Trypanosoma vivax]